MQASFAPPAPSALPASGRPEFSQTSAGVMGMQWSALHDAAAEVGKLAGLAPEAMLPEVRNFPALIRDVGGWRRDQAEQGVEDLSAVMEPGIAALLAICANGTNPAPAALALWQEFHAARTALLALTPPLQT
ncbi:MAG: hypothetical protein ABL912_12865 [Novosphingobium sp.]